MLMFEKVVKHTKRLLDQLQWSKARNKSVTEVDVFANLALPDDKVDSDATANSYSNGIVEFERSLRVKKIRKIIIIRLKVQRNKGGKY